MRDDAQNPILIQTVETATNCGKNMVSKDNKYLFAVAGNEGLKIINIREHANAFIITSIEAQADIEYSSLELNKLGTTLFMGAETGKIL